MLQGLFVIALTVGITLAGLEAVSWIILKVSKLVKIFIKCKKVKT